MLRFAAGLPMVCGALPAWAFASKEFWEAKPASEWTSDEIDRMLTKSPWAKDASAMSSGQGLSNGSGRSRSGGIGFPGGGGAGGIGFPGGRVGFPGGGGGGRQGGGYPGGGGNDGGRERLTATVRWESALPIQEALRIGASDEKPNGDFEKYYVIALIGDLSASGARRRSTSTNGGTSDDDDDSTTRADRRLEELKESTRLERKDGPISLEKVEEGSRVGSRGPGVYFYFDRKADVSMDDKFVNFSTKLGRMDIKAKFTMKEMSYHGKLAV